MDSHLKDRSSQVTEEASLHSENITDSAYKNADLQKKVPIQETRRSSFRQRRSNIAALQVTNLRLPVEKEENDALRQSKHDATQKVLASELTAEETGESQVFRRSRKLRYSFSYVERQDTLLYENEVKIDPKEYTSHIENKAYWIFVILELILMLWMMCPRKRV